MQVGRWFGRLLTGDLGQSIYLNRPVLQTILERAEPTLMLTLLATLFAVVVGLPIGIVSATRAGSWADLGAMLVAMGGISMPSFWVGLNLIFVFAVLLGALPVAGVPAARPRGLGEPPLPHPARRDAGLRPRRRSWPGWPAPMMLEVLREDYVRTARAKGVGGAPGGARPRAAERHGAAGHGDGAHVRHPDGRGGSSPSRCSTSRGSAGCWVQSVLRRDYPVVQGIVLVIAFNYVVINLAVDVLYGLFDPRVRHS